MQLKYTFYILFILFMVQRFRKEFFMKWNYYLKHPTFIANRMDIKIETVKRWSQLNHVPPPRFESLQDVLASLGYELTTIEMRGLNEQKTY